MDDTLTLYHELADRLHACGAAVPVTDLALAAFRGDETLTAVLRGKPLPAAPTATPGTAEEPHVFLESVEVTGFRGIGAPAALRLKPEPGLTVLSGRNGSAKSSFAESIEYVLTDDSPRWSQRSALFLDGWRNLHHDGDREITVKLRLDSGGPPVSIRRSWAAGETNLAAATTTVEQGGAPSGALPRWAGSVDRFRPFLSARDLDRVVTSKPTELYDSIAPLLGLAPLSTASVRLQALRKERDDRATALRATFNDLRARLGTLPDPRAAEAVRLLGGQAGKAVLATLAELAGGESGGKDEDAASAARRLAQVELPAIGITLAELAQATAAVEKLAGTEVAITHRMSVLLWGALEIHLDLGDQSCPVCQVGVLDGAWREGAEQEFQRLRAATATMRAATQQRQELHRRVEGQIDDVRRALEPIAAVLAGVLPAPASAVGDALDSLTADETSWAAVTAAHADLAAAATRWLARWHDAWQEPGAAIRRWVDDATVVRAEAAELALLTKARSELTKAADQIRADRFQDAAGQSEHIWQLLRQQSNVAVGAIKLGGTNNRRRVDISVAVDGTDTSALAVMSQGELHAFGLALFLPRACAEASPYRFVVIDDPVQSMDPAKVDGLAEVLREVAQTRQVVVFTHDDRLPEAIRRLGVEADLWEVVRQEGSVVTVRRNSDPADRYLDDARSVAKADIPEEAKRLMVAGFCRSALEAAAMDRYRKTQYEAGASRHDIDAALDATHSLQDKLTLGVFGDPARRRDLYGYLNGTRVSRAVDTVRAVAKAMHEPADMATAEMVTTSTALVAMLR